MLPPLREALAEHGLADFVSQDRQHFGGTVWKLDAETGELHQDISDGQRAHDLYTAEINLFGELSDLESGGLLDPSIDPLETAPCWPWSWPAR